MAKKKRRNGKSKRRNRTYKIAARGSSDMSPEKEIEAVYNYIRTHPGLVKSQIIKKCRTIGMSKQRLWSRWDTIRDYLRDNKSNNLNRLNPDGQPWIYGEANTPNGKRHKYYAVDPSLDFVPAEPVTVGIEYTPRKKGLARVGPVARAAKEGAVPVIDEPEGVVYAQGDEDCTQEDCVCNEENCPFNKVGMDEDLPVNLDDILYCPADYEPSDFIKATPEEVMPLPDDLVTIRYRGCVIRIKPGSTITLD